MTVLLTCSGGGHLKQLHSLVPRMGLGDEDRLWVTFDTGLSRSLLADEDVVFTSYSGPRDVRGIATNALAARRLLASRRFSLAVSTGSSLAVSYLPQTALRGTPSHFVETAARALGPSLSGRILQRVPPVRTYTQYPAWASSRWAYAGSVFDAYTAGPQRPARPPARVVVSLGTTESYGFRALVARLAPLVAGAEVLWQVGTTDTTGLGIEARPHVEHEELRTAIAEADLVVAHSGTGAALTALEQGRCPLLVPRRRARGEHVDDHQVEIAAELDRRGLAVAREVGDLDADALLAAASRTVVRAATVPPFALTGR